MTIFVASLFLPYTASFKVPKPTPPKDGTIKEKYEKERPRLSLSASAQTIPTLSSLHVASASSPPIPSERAYFKQPVSKAKATAPAKNIVDERKYIPGTFQIPSLKIANPAHNNRISNTRDNTFMNGRVRAPSVDNNAFLTAPWDIVPFTKGNGGLRNAVFTSLKVNAIPSDLKWVGTIGMPTDSLPESTISSINAQLSSAYDCEVVNTSDSNFQGHYKHFCKQILWPTLHYQMSDKQMAKAYEDHSWENYKSLNQLIANKIVKLTSKSNTDDIIWIHDYHLMLVPQMIREQLPKAKIGFFLHVSFPSSEVFRCLAAREKILQGLLGANCIAFQTTEYATHFIQTCNRLLAVDVSEDGIIADGNLIRVISHGVGIDPTNLELQLQQPKITQYCKIFRERWPDKALIVGRDKLDIVRGLKPKLLAYEEFLNRHPEWIGKAVLVQACYKSNKDMELQGQVMQIVDRINSLNQNIGGSQPVVLYHQDIDFEQYLALMCEADAFAVTSLREGMNLTCHEYVVCAQERKGVLILSEFTGAADVMGPGALLVNPWDKREVAEAYHKALTMSKIEKAQRWNKLYSYVTKHTGVRWCTEVLNSIDEACSEQYQRQSSNIPKLDIEKFRNIYFKCCPSNSRNSVKRVFFLSMNPTPTVVKGGTNISKTVAIPLTRRLAIISDLVSDPMNVVYIMSSSSKLTMERTYKRIPGLGLIAENGGYLKPANSGTGGGEFWISIVDESKLTWKNSVKNVILSMAERLPGSFVEELDCSLRFYLGSAEDAERARTTAGSCVGQINNFYNDTPMNGSAIHATLVGDVVVVQPHEDLSVKATGFALDLITTGNLLTSPSVSLSATGYINGYQILQSPQESPLSQPKEEIFSNGYKPLSIGMIFVSGGINPFDEAVFDYINNRFDVNTDFDTNNTSTRSEVEKQGNTYSLTVSIATKAATSANVSVNGINELLSIIKEVSV